VLRLTDRGRQRIVDEDEAARRLDTFAFRAQAALRRIAARRGSRRERSCWSPNNPNWRACRR
jgi:hypothetical protein